MKKLVVAGLVAFAGLVPSMGMADERLFTYSYEAEILPEGTAEFEQWITNQSGKEDGDYTEWNFRSEFEFGVTQNYMTSFYINLDDVRSEGVTGVEEDRGTDFKGISWENVYQLLNPNLDPVGLAAYLEYTSDGIDHELESKILLSKPVTDKLTLAVNAVYEMEWEKENGEQEKEAEFEVDGGASYKVAPKWNVGVEFRNKTAYPGGLDLSGQEFNSWSVGPNVHYGSPTWWGTFTVLPQVWGNGDGASGGRQLVHEESMEVRLIFGRSL